MLINRTTPPTAVGSSALRVQLTYLWRHRRLARLAKPLLFTEWVQHRKLNDRDSRLPVLADKVAVKEWVAAMLGGEWVTPTLWRGRALPPDSAWDYPFIVKARHGCNQSTVVRNAADYAEAVSGSCRWMAGTYGGWLDEWLYGGIEPGLLVEPLIGAGGGLPVDYKIFVFGGVARFIQVHLGRGTDHRWIVFDRRWQRVSPSTKDPDPGRPRSLDRMVHAAERLATDFPFVRVDLYEVSGRPRFGEMTFYPGSGLERVEPPSLDLLMGLLWRSALEGQKAGRARLAA